ncbi:LuxR C-terminal-related transcriptional regulator [Nocardia asteroides]
MVTTRDNLANREVVRYLTVLEEYGFDIVRMNPDDAPRPPEPGRPTIYIGTQQDVGFASLREHWIPGRSVAIDEIDEALIHADTQYILSDGADQAAHPAIAAQVTRAHKFLTNALDDGRLTEADFGRTPGQRGGPARLTEEGRRKLEQALGREPTEDELTRIAMAAAARWEYVENVHYVVHNDKVFIIDQTTHKVLFDPTTSSESRWNGGLAQAIEAEHGLRIRNDPSSSKSITAQQLFSPENYDHVTGASGTAEGSAAQLQQRYGLGEVAKIDRFHTSQLVVHPDSISPDEASKLETIAADIKAMQETGRPQLVLADRNDLVAPLSALLDRQKVAHTAVDAKWFLDKGPDAEAELQDIFDHAGERGKVLVINMQGARGVDIPIDDDIRDLLGLHVVVTGRSARSRDIDIQAENRSARNGDPGSARYYTSPEDDLYALSAHPLVQTVVVQYTRATTDHQAQPTPETEAALTRAEDQLRALVDPLQEFAALLNQAAHTPADHTTDPATRGPPTTPTDETLRQPQHPPPIGFRPASHSLPTAAPNQVSGDSPQQIADARHVGPTTSDTDGAQPQTASPESGDRQAPGSVLHRAQQGDQEAFEALRRQYGRDTLRHVREVLGVPNAPQNPQEERLAQLAQGVNSTVFQYAERRQWPVPEGQNVGSWLHHIADDVVEHSFFHQIRAGVLEAMRDGAVSESPTDYRLITEMTRGTFEAIWTTDLSQPERLWLQRRFWLGLDPTAAALHARSSGAGLSVALIDLDEVAIRRLAQAVAERTTRSLDEQPLGHDLSEREFEVLRLVARGMTNPEIGTELGISERTVQAHLSRIYRKLGTDGRMETTATLVQAGLLPGEHEVDRSRPDRDYSRSQFTEREREVLDLVGKGLTNPEIVAALEISDSTVKSHLTNIRHKLGIVDRAELAAIAVRLSKFAELSARELEVLALVADGQTDAAIAEALGISEDTVRSHLAHTRSKLDTDGRAESVEEARRAGLLPARTLAATDEADSADSRGASSEHDVVASGPAGREETKTDRQLLLTTLVYALGVAESAPARLAFERVSESDLRRYLNQMGPTEWTALADAVRAAHLGRDLDTGQRDALDEVTELVVAGHSPTPGDLSDREVQILSLVAEGMSNKQIGEALELSGATVKVHLTRIGQKLGITDRAGMVVAAIRAHQIPRENPASTPHPDSGKLTDREIEILGLVALGMSNKEIAEELEVAPATVKHALTRSGGKLGIGERAGMAVAAIRAGKLPLHDPVDELAPANPADTSHPVLRLTERETEILLLRARGMTIAEVAEVSGISAATVNTHMGRIVRKLGLGDNIDLEQAARRAECVIQLVRALWALGHDSAIEPALGENLWPHVENAIAAQLVEIDLPAITAEAVNQQSENSDPLASLVDAIRNNRGGGDTAVVIVERGTKSHGYVITDVDGEVVVSDSLASPQVRHYDAWEPPYPRVDRAFVAWFKSDDGVLTAARDSVPDGVVRSHPRNAITGRPPTEPERPNNGDLEALSQPSGRGPQRAVPREGSITGPPAGHTPDIEQLRAAVDTELLELVIAGVQAERDAAVTGPPTEVEPVERIDQMLAGLYELRAAMDQPDTRISPARFRILVQHFHAVMERLAALTDAENITAEDRHPAAGAQQLYDLRDSAQQVAEARQRFTAADHRIDDLAAALDERRTGEPTTSGDRSLLETVDTDLLRSLHADLRTELAAAVVDPRSAEPAEVARYQKLRGMFVRVEELLNVVDDPDAAIPQERLRLLVFHFHAAVEWLAFKDANHADATNFRHVYIRGREQLVTEAIDRFRIADDRVRALASSLNTSTPSGAAAVPPEVASPAQDVRPGTGRDVVANAVASFPQIFNRPRTLEELPKTLPDDTSYEEISALRALSHVDNGVVPHDVSRESLEILLRKIWENRHSIETEDDVYVVYTESSETNLVTDHDRYVQEILGILEHRPLGQQEASAQTTIGKLTFQPSDARHAIPSGMIHFIRFKRAGAISRDVQFRVYVNPQGDAAPELMRSLVLDVVDRPEQFPGIHSAKVAGPRETRADGIVVYVNELADAHRVVAWLREHHRDKLMWSVPPMSFQMAEGVSIGAEPMGGSSFGQIRAWAIFDALRSTMEADGDFTAFHDGVIAGLPEADVDPDRPWLPAGSPRWRDHHEIDLISAAGVTDRGGQSNHQHNVNEDSFGLTTAKVGDERWTLAVVADGVSSQGHSEEASEAATRAATYVLHEEAARVARGGRPDAAETARRAFEAAHRAVQDLIAAKYAASDLPPATTLVLTVATPTRLVTLSRGDSPAYWIPRDGGPAIKLTDDDPAIVEMAESLGMTVHELRHSWLASSLNSYVGKDTEPGELQPSVHNVTESGFVALFSDGAVNIYHEDESNGDTPEQRIADSLRQKLAESSGNLLEASRAFVRHAIDAGEYDNVTAVLASPGPSAPHPASSKQATPTEPAQPENASDLSDQAGPDSADRTPRGGGIPPNPLPPGVELFHYTDPNPADPHFPHRPHGVGFNKFRNLNQLLVDFHHPDDRLWDQPRPRAGEDSPDNSAVVVEFQEGDPLDQVLVRTNEVITHALTGRVRRGAVAMWTAHAVRTVDLALRDDVSAGPVRIAVRLMDVRDDVALEVVVSDDRGQRGAYRRESDAVWTVEAARPYSDLDQFVNSALPRLDHGRDNPFGPLIKDLTAIAGTDPRTGARGMGSVRIDASRAALGTHELRAEIRGPGGAAELSFSAPDINAGTDHGPVIRVSTAIDPEQDFDHTVSAIVYTVQNLTSEWPGSRAIAASGIAEDLLVTQESSGARGRFDIEMSSRRHGTQLAFSLVDPATGTTTARASITEQDADVAPPERVGETALWEVVIAPDADRAGVLADIDRQLRGVWTPVDPVMLLVDELVGNVVRHPDADGVLVLTALRMGDSRVLAIDLHVRGGSYSPSDLARDHAEYLDVHNRGGDGYVVRAVLRDDTAESAGLAAALLGENSSEHDGRVTTTALPEGLGAELSSAARRALEGLASTAPAHSGGQVDLAVVESTPGYVRLAAIDLSPVARQEPAVAQEERHGDEAQRPQAVTLRAGEADEQLIRAAIDGLARQWPSTARTAAAETAGAVVADATRRGNTRAEVALPEADVLRVTVVHEGAADLTPELVRVLELGATGWRAESYGTDSRRVVSEFHLLDDAVRLPERASDTVSADDPVLGSDVVQLSPVRRAPRVIRELVVDSMSRRTGPFWLHTAPMVNEATTLAETLLREVSQGRRPVTATATITESGRWTLEVVEDGAERPRSGWIVYRPSSRYDPWFTPSGDYPVDTVVEHVRTWVRDEMIRHRWTDPEQLDAAEIVITRRVGAVLAAAPAVLPDGRPEQRRLHLTVSGSPGAKLLTLRVGGWRDGDNVPVVVELAERTVVSGLTSSAAMQFFRNRWLAELHWSAGVEHAAAASDLFAGADFHSQAEWLVTADARADRTELSRRTDALVRRVLEDVPSEIRRATGLVKTLVTELLTAPAQDGLVTAAVAMGSRGLELRIAVSVRDTSGLTTDWQVESLVDPQGASRAGVESWGPYTTTWVAVDLPAPPTAADQRAAPRRPGDPNRPPGSATTSDFLDRAAAALGEKAAPPGADAAAAPTGRRGVAEFLTDADELLAQQQNDGAPMAPPSQGTRQQTTDLSNASTDGTQSAAHPHPSGARPDRTAAEPDQPPSGSSTRAGDDGQSVRGTVVVREIGSLPGENRKSVAGLVTAVAPESGPNHLVLHAVEARGPAHAALAKTVGSPWLISIETDGYAARCNIRWRIHDDGRLHAFVSFENPDVHNPHFAKVRGLIDAALLNRFPGRVIDVVEDFEGKIVALQRDLGPDTAPEQPRAVTAPTPWSSRNAVASSSAQADSPRPRKTPWQQTASSEPGRRTPDGADRKRKPPARRTGLIGGVPDLVNPLDDRGSPWDRGGPVPRHKRMERLGVAHADGGGFARGNQSEPPADNSRPDNASASGEAARKTPTDAPGSPQSDVAPVELSPSARRVLDATMREVEEVAAEALRPLRDVGVDVTSLYRKETAAIERLIEILRAQQGARFDAVLRRLVADDQAAETLAEALTIADAMPTIREQYQLLAEHIESYRDYAHEVRTALAILAARDVLAAEGAVPYVDDAGRRVEGIGIGPGRRVVVASPFRGQQALLDSFVEGGSALAAQGLRIDYRLVRVDEDGRVTAEPISGLHDEQEPIQHFYQDRETVAWINGLTDERPFAQKLAEVLQDYGLTGERPVTELLDEAVISGKAMRLHLKPDTGDQTMSESVYQITFDNGFKVIVKTVRNVDQADAEELGAIVLEAVGARPPKVVRLDERVLAVEYVPGVVAEDIYQDRKDPWWYFRPTPAAQRLGLGDVLIRPPDRHEGRNWILEHGVHIVPIDNSLAFENNWPPGGFTEQFVTIDVDVWAWMEHHVSRTELAEIRQRLLAAEPEFARLNRRHPRPGEETSWYEDVLELFSEIERHAADRPATPSAAEIEITALLEELRDQLVMRYFGELMDGRPVREPRHEWTWRTWRKVVAYLEQRFAGYPSPGAERDIAVLKSLVQLHLHAQMNEVGADELDEDTFPNLTDEYLDALAQRLDDIEKGAKYPDFNGESYEEWLARFDRELGLAAAQSPVSTGDTALPDRHGDDATTATDHRRPTEPSVAPAQRSGARPGHPESVADNPAGLGLDIPGRESSDLGTVPPPRGQRFDPGLVHAIGPHPDGHAVGGSGHRTEPSSTPAASEASRTAPAVQPDNDITDNPDEAAAQPEASPAPTLSQGPELNRLVDELEWLEDVHGERPLAWVRAHNQLTEEEFTLTPEFDALRDRILTIIGNRDRVTRPVRFGDWLYDFRRDEAHPRGLWRRTVVADYHDGEPVWEVLLDLDALAAAEGKSWVWGLAKILRDGQHRALISLADGGGDINVVREYDLEAKRFVPPAEGGFALPPARNRFSWADENTVYVGTDFGPGSFTRSGSPRIAKLWRRGTALSEAETLLEADFTNGVVAAGYEEIPGMDRHQVIRYIDMNNSVYYVVRADGSLQQLDVPTDAKVRWIGNRLMVEPGSTWNVDGREYPAGSLLVADLDAFLAGERAFDEVFTPDAHTVLHSYAWTAHHLLLTLMSDVRTKIEVLTPTAEGWTRRTIETTSEISTTAVAGVDPLADDDALLLHVSGFTTPASVLAGSVDGTFQVVSRSPRSSMPPT